MVMEQADRCAPRNNMKIAERTEEAGYRRVRQSLFGVESFLQRQIWPAPPCPCGYRIGNCHSARRIFFQLWLKTIYGLAPNPLVTKSRFHAAAGKIQRSNARPRENSWHNIPILSRPSYILAEAAEKENLEEAISWRGQIARLRPKDPDSQLNLVSAALRFGKLDLARKALGSNSCQ